MTPSRPSTVTPRSNSWHPREDHCRPVGQTGYRRGGTHQEQSHAAEDEPCHPDCDDHRRGADDHLLQGQAQEGYRRPRVAERHGGRGSHLWHRMAGRHLFCQLPGRDTADALGHGREVPVVDCIRLLPGIGACQLTGRRGRVDVAAGLPVGHRWLGAAGCVAIGIWLLLHPQLSLGYRDGEL